MGSNEDDPNFWIQKAQKSLKTSLFKRTPDYDSAIEAYTKAALIYRKTRSLENSAEIYKQIAELHYKTGSYFHCAKNYDLASGLYKELKQFDQAADLVLQAGELLQTCGALDSAAYVYGRAAAALEHQLPSRAAEFYEKAAITCGTQDHHNEAADYCNNAARVFVRLRDLANAERLLRLYIAHCEQSSSTSMSCTTNASVGHLVARAALVLVLIKLSQSDEVAAQKVHAEAVQRWKFHETEEGCVASSLISACEQRIGDTITQLLRAPCLRNMDQAYTELLRDVSTAFPDHAPSSRKDQPGPGNQSTEIAHGTSSSNSYPDTVEDEDIC